LALFLVLDNAHIEIRLPPGEKNYRRDGKINGIAVSYR
jgi:hypothetical protein